MLNQFELTCFEGALPFVCVLERAGAWPKGPACFCSNRAEKNLSLCDPWLSFVLNTHTHLARSPV